MKIELKATDKVGVSTAFTINNSMASEEDLEQFFIELFVFLERAGAAIEFLPDEVLAQIDQFYEDKK